VIYYNEVNLHGFMKLFNFHGMRKCTLHLALDGAFHGATKPVQKYENFIDLSTIIWSCEIKVFIL